MTETPPRPVLGRDPLGLRHALADRLLPALVGAMALLGALALTAAEGAGALAARWRGDLTGIVTVQLPDADPGRAAAALASLAALPEVASARPIAPERLAALLRPWLGPDMAGLPEQLLPSLLEVRLAAPPTAPEALAAKLATAAPGAVVELQGLWLGRLVALSDTLRRLALAVLLLVAGVAVAVVIVAVQAGIAARRESIVILHDIGATDGAIAGRFAARIAWLAGGGALAGTLLALPLLVGLAGLAVPLAGGAAGSAAGSAWGRLPWLGLALLPPGAALLGWSAAQATLRLWLQRLP